jgi:hypothetical protein
MAAELGESALKSAGASKVLHLQEALGQVPLPD